MASGKSLEKKRLSRKMLLYSNYGNPIIVNKGGRERMSKKERLRRRKAHGK